MQREGKHEQCQEYDEVSVRLYHFAERYLDKLVNEQCHIEYIQEHYQIEKF